MTAVMTSRKDADRRIINGCHVVASSGCHRYNFWNDQAVFDGRDDTGWCSLSRTAPQNEYLLVDLGKETTPRSVAIQRRPAPNLTTGFPRGLVVTAVGSDGETLLLESDNVFAEAGSWWEHDLAVSVITRHVRITMPNVDRRSSGSYFMQIMGLRFTE
jgi:hypothetical protein